MAQFWRHIHHRVIAPKHASRASTKRSPSISIVNPFQVQLELIAMTTVLLRTEMQVCKLQTPYLQLQLHSSRSPISRSAHSYKRPEITRYQATSHIKMVIQWGRIYEGQYQTSDQANPSNAAGSLRERQQFQGQGWDKRVWRAPHPPDRSRLVNLTLLVLHDRMAGK